MTKQDTIQIPDGYQQTKVGVIPEDWEVKSLGDIGVFIRGKGISKSEIISDGLPCIRYGEIYTEHDFYVKSMNSFISKESAEQSRRIYQNDLLFVSSGETLLDIGKCVAYLSNEEAYAGGDIVILRESVQNSLFLGFLLNQEIVNRQKYKFGQGHSVVHIYSSTLKQILIPLPSPAEQKVIADCLSVWDTAIEKQQALIDEKELRKKGLMQQLLSGEKRLKGFEDEWEEVALADIVEEYKKKPVSDASLPVFTSSKNGLLLQSEYYLNSRITQRKNVDYNVLPIGYLTYRSRSDDGIFTFNFNDQNVIGLISGYYPVFKFVKSNNIFMHRFINYYNNIFKKYAIGTSQLVLSINVFKKVKVFIPSLKEQTAIAEILSAADKEIDFEKQRLQQLKDQKKGLMQQLLTGKKRLKIN